MTTTPHSSQAPLAPLTPLPHLSHADQATYDAILRHPAAHNLHWRDVRSLLGSIGEVVEGPGTSVKVTRGSRTLFLHPHEQKEFGGEEQLKELRAFLKASSSSTALTATGLHLLVVIDHREARIFKTDLAGAVPQKITPHDPGNNGRHLHYVQEDSNGQRRPEQPSYYRAIAETMRGAEGILIFGSGTGASSAMEHLLTELKTHYREIAEHVVGSVVVDEHHLSEEQLLAKAREFYAKGVKA